MKKLAIGVGVLVVFGFAIFMVLTSPAVWQMVHPSRDVAEGGAPDLNIGKTLFRVSDCAICHSSAGQNDETLLGGGRSLNSAFGTFYMPNISPHPQDGIGQLTTAQFIRAVREGVSAHGDNEYPVFPFTSYQHMTANDLRDMFAYIQTLPPVPGKVRDHDLKFPFTMRRGVGLWRLAFLDGKPLTPEPQPSLSWNRGRYLVEGPAHCYIRYKDFRDDPLLNALGTPSGRFEIFSKNIAKMNYDDCPPHPAWMEPVERLAGPTTKYPLHVDSSHPKYRLHSQLCGTKLRSAYAIAGREPCLMNPKDAAPRGVRDGDVIRVFNDRGQILAGVKLTDDIRPGVIRINEGGWFDPVDARRPGSLCRYGDVNALSIGIGTSKLAQGNCGHTAVAQVEKYRGNPPGTEVFNTPRGA